MNIFLSSVALHPTPERNTTKEEETTSSVDEESGNFSTPWSESLMVKECAANHCEFEDFLKA